MTLHKGPPDVLPYASPTLPDEDRRALGRLHPSFRGKDRILYRVVDESGGGTLTAKRTRSSKRPLSLGGLSAVRGGDTGGDRWVVCGGMTSG